MDGDLTRCVSSLFIRLLSTASFGRFRMRYPQSSRAQAKTSPLKRWATLTS